MLNFLWDSLVFLGMISIPSILLFFFVYGKIKEKKRSEVVVKPLQQVELSSKKGLSLRTFIIENQLNIKVDESRRNLTRRERRIAKIRAMKNPPTKIVVLVKDLDELKCALYYYNTHRNRALGWEIYSSIDL